MGDPQEQDGPWAKYQAPVQTAEESGPWAKYAATAQSSPVAPEPEMPSLLEQGWDTAKDFAKGAAKGLMHTAGVLGEHATPPYLSGTGVGANNAPAAPMVPHGLAQQLGYGGEQAGEWLAPTGAEEHLAALLPKAGKAIPLAKLGTQAVESGVRNMTQGGNFKTGAEAGAGGELVNQGLQKAAPIIAESALGVTNRMRGHGRTIGDAALNEVSAVRPASILKQSGDKVRALTGQLEQAASNSTAPASTSPAIKVVDDALATYQKRNSPMVGKLQSLRDQLTTNTTTGKAIPAQLPASDVLELKRGVGDLISSWAPGEQKGAKPIIQRVYGALDKELDRTVPEAQELNQRISSLIPVKQRSSILANGAPTAQRIMHRMSAHTGALAGSGIGAGLGYQRGGVPGAIVGGTMGIAVPELLASPTAQMAAARVMKSGYAPQLGKAIALQLDRSPEEEKEEANKEQ